MILQSEVTRSYNSFSGADIRAVIGSIPFAELQAISYSVTREKAPIYTMGSPDPRSFSRNKRGIAGSLIWINFDRHGLLNIFRQYGGTFVANKDDVRPQYRYESRQEYLEGATLFNTGLARSTPIPITATIDKSMEPISEVSSWKEAAMPWYCDQILPFDVTLAGTNENGAATSMKIFGLEILNEGSGVSVDDAVQEMQATYVARAIEPWQAVESRFNTVFTNNSGGI